MSLIMAITATPSFVFVDFLDHGIFVPVLGPRNTIDGQLHDFPVLLDGPVTHKCVCSMYNRTRSSVKLVASFW